MHSSWKSHFAPGTIEQYSDVYAYHTSIVEIIPLELDHLRAVLHKDFNKLEMFWKFIAYRMITINWEKLKHFKMLSQDNLKKFCRLSDTKVYKCGFKIPIENGGIVLCGKMTLLQG